MEDAAEAERRKVDRRDGRAERREQRRVLARAHGAQRVLHDAHAHAARERRLQQVQDAHALRAAVGRVARAVRQRPVVLPDVQRLLRARNQVRPRVRRPQRRRQLHLLRDALRIQNRRHLFLGPRLLCLSSRCSYHLHQKQHKREEKQEQHSSSRFHFLEKRKHNTFIHSWKTEKGKGKEKE